MNQPKQVTADTIEKTLSVEEEANLEKAKEAVDRFHQALMDSKLTGMYKMELHLHEDRSRTRPYGGLLVFTTSGTKLDGEGDEKVYICPDDKCESPLPPASRLFGGRLVCPNCEMVWDEKRVTGEIYFKLPERKWAQVLEKWFLKLSGNADVLVKQHKAQLRDKTFQELAKPSEGVLVNSARNVRGPLVYPLKHIIKDTANGSSLQDRFLAFLRA